MKKLAVLSLLILLASVGASALEAEPTPEPQTKPSFDYAAIVADPDAHDGCLDYMVGEVVQYEALGDMLDAFDEAYALVITVDGVVSHRVVIYSGYNTGEDHPIVGDTVFAQGVCLGVMEHKNALGMVLHYPKYVCNVVQIYPRD